jgi:hypothetical protein
VPNVARVSGTGKIGHTRYKTKKTLENTEEEIESG